jgi:hypothetical protein
MARCFYRGCNLIIIVFYTKVLNNFAEVSSLRESKSIVRTVANYFYSKIKVIGAKV